MLPFCGYNMADYWGHWLEMQDKLGDKFPKVYQVNWFRKDEDGKFMWPGYGDNSRVLDWIVRRAAGEVEAIDGVTGRYPKFEDFNLEGLDVDEATWAKMFDDRPRRLGRRDGRHRGVLQAVRRQAARCHQGAAGQVPRAHRRGQEGLIRADLRASPGGNSGARPFFSPRG